MTLLPTVPALGLLILRLFLGPIMIAHGYPKLFNRQVRGQAMEGMKGMGVPVGLTIIATLIELLGGLGLVLGLLTQFAAIFIFLEMVGTTILQRTKMGKKLIGGYELDISYLAIALALAFLGPGTISLDHLFGLA